VRISLDGRGRGFDTMCGERRWRRVKSEEVDRKADRRVPDARHGWQGDFACYTRARIQPSLHYQPPAAVYRQGPKRAAVTTVNCRVIGLDSGEYFTFLEKVVVAWKLVMVASIMGHRWSIRLIAA
jgi:hypothetical protein